MKPVTRATHHPHLLVELESPEPVADVACGRADGLGVVGRQADVADGEVHEGDRVLAHRQPRLRGAPACKTEKREIKFIQ